LMGEYHRWSSDLPDLGWAYAASLVGTMITTADHFARQGDTSLYDYVTSDGAVGTEGGPKSLLLTVYALGQHVDGTFQHYGTDIQDRAGNEAYLIDGVNAASNWYGLHDVLVAQS